MVVGIHRVVEEPDAGYGSHCLNQGVNDVGISAFAEVRDAFDEWPHRHILNETKKPKGAVVPPGFLSYVRSGWFRRGYLVFFTNAL
jgi:hypothetical protein